MEIIKTRLQDSTDVMTGLLANETRLETFDDLADEIVKSIKNGNKLILYSNEIFTSHVLYYSGDIVGRFRKKVNGQL